jgi:hypothetical protein
MTYIGAQYTITHLKREIGHKHTTLPKILYWRHTSNARLKSSSHQPKTQLRGDSFSGTPFNLKNHAPNEVL